VKLIIIGTDHRLQQSVAQAADSKTWVPRSAYRYRRLITYCIEKLGAKAILEEAHADQERTSPTICSTIAKERNLSWKAISLGEPTLNDALFDPPLMDAIRTRVTPYALAGIYDLEWHAQREEFMHAIILQSMREHNPVLAIVGQIHLGVLAQRFLSENIPVKAFLFTYPLVVDETRS
jgi:hypothetical protein